MANAQSEPPRPRLRSLPATPRRALRALALAPALSAVLLVAACRSAGPPPAVPAAPPVLIPPPAPDPLTVADRAYSAADYPTAVAAYEAYLSAHADADDADRALFQLGLVLLLPDNRTADPAAARARLRTLVDRFPASPYAPQARSLLALLDEIDRLKGEVRTERGRTEALKKDFEAQKKDLEALKRIDLGAKPPAP